MSWINVKEKLPEPLQTVWISNGKGWTTLGCRSDISYGDNNELTWCWAVTTGIIYEENGQIVAECEESDIEVQSWHPVPNTVNVSNDN